MATTDPSERGFDEQHSRTIPADDCPERAGPLRMDNGETRCSECGLVVSVCRVDRRGPRTFDEDETDRRRTAVPLTEARRDRGISTKIGRTTDSPMCGPGSARDSAGCPRLRVASLRFSPATRGQMYTSPRRGIFQ
jgi:transcription initiation factor TFIIIB Brf1 subunit/transcription initiation factor TFIIB